MPSPIKSESVARVVHRSTERSSELTPKTHDEVPRPRIKYGAGIGRPHLSSTWIGEGIGATFASWHNILFLLQVITVKKNVAPFACDLSVYTAQAGLWYCIIPLSGYSKLLGFALAQPNLQHLFYDFI